MRVLRMSRDRISGLRRAPGFRRIDHQIWVARCAWRSALCRLFLNQLVRKVRRTGRLHGLEELFRLTREGFHGVLYPVQNRSEILALLELVRAENPRRILEIGTATGGTLFLFSRVAADDATLASIDLPGGPGGDGEPAWKVPLYPAFALPGQRVELIRDDSHDARILARTRQLFGDEPIDFLFIDGDHSYEGVKRDFEMYGPLVRPGGIIAFHDITYIAQVGQFWDELKAQGLATREFLGDRGQVFGIGVVRKGDPRGE
jgi:predicted O-methyltransferase YrrM